jgi:hypothetical protein
MGLTRSGWCRMDFDCWENSQRNSRNQIVEPRQRQLSNWVVWVNSYSTQLYSHIIEFGSGWFKKACTVHRTLRNWCFTDFTQLISGCTHFPNLVYQIFWCFNAEEMMFWGSCSAPMTQCEPAKTVERKWVRRRQSRRSSSNNSLEPCTQLEVIGVGEKLYSVDEQWHQRRFQLLNNRWNFLGQNLLVPNCFLDYFEIDPTKFPHRKQLDAEVVRGCFAEVAFGANRMTCVLSDPLVEARIGLWKLRTAFVLRGYWWSSRRLFLAPSGRPQIQLRRFQISTLTTNGGALLKLWSKRLGKIGFTASGFFAEINMSEQCKNVC